MTKKTELINVGTLPELTDKTIQAAVTGLDRAGYRTVRIEFTDGTWIECQADGYDSTLNYEYSANTA